MARVKKKDHEKLTSTNIRHVITLLNPSQSPTPQKPITKKDACKILNIAYNTVRLQRIIDEFKEKETFIATRKSQNKGKRASDVEITQTITEYLQGEPVSEIAKSLYRSAGFVNGIIRRIGVPNRVSKTEGKTVELLPEQCIAETFSNGQVVWSAKYHSTAIVVKQLEEEQYETNYGSKCYQISIIEQIDASESFFKHIESGGFNAFALAYDLGSLKHLEEYGIKLKNIS